jgi:hypothetical protein
MSRKPEIVIHSTNQKLYILFPAIQRAKGSAGAVIGAVRLMVMGMPPLLRKVDEKSAQRKYSSTAGDQRVAQALFNLGRGDFSSSTRHARCQRQENKKHCPYKYYFRSVHCPAVLILHVLAPHIVFVSGLNCYYIVKPR